MRPIGAKGDRHQQLGARFFDETLDQLDKNFKDKFTEEHRKLKASIHQCQYTAYSREGFSLDESENLARNCFKPLLLLRRHAQTL